MFGVATIGGSAFSPEIDHFEAISMYLPVEIRSELESVYFARHLKSFVDNQYTNLDYSALALHQIFMFCAYGLLYGHMHDRPELSNNAFVITPSRREERDQLRSITSPFTLSLLNERTFFDLIALVGCDTTADMPQLKGLVDGRNDLAHCNGKMCSNLEAEVLKYVDGFEVLQNKFANIASPHLLEIENIDYGATRDIQIDQMRTFVSEHYLSSNMLNLLIPFAADGQLTKRAFKLLEEYLSL